MKKLLALAAFLLASTAAQAQYTFEYGGRTIRIDPDRGTVSIPGVYDNTGRRNKRSAQQAGAAAGQGRSAGTHCRTCADRAGRCAREHSTTTLNRHSGRRPRG